MKAIHSILKKIPIEWAFVAWFLLTGIGTIGGISYFFSAPINGVVYLVSLVMAVLYMFRRVPEKRWYKFWAVVWSVMTIACIWKLIPFVGWLLAIVDIVLFWHFHYVADRNHQSQQKKSHHRHRTKGFFPSKVYTGNAADAAPWWGRNKKNLWTGNEIFYGYARIPVIRIPNPLVWYCFDKEQGTAYRDTLFESMNSQEIANIYDCNFPKSGGFYRFIRGSLHLEFDFTKYGKNTTEVWSNLHPDLAEKIHSAHAKKKK